MQKNIKWRTGMFNLKRAIAEMEAGQYAQAERSLVKHMNITLEFMKEDFDNVETAHTVLNAAALFGLLYNEHMDNLQKGFDTMVFADKLSDMDIFFNENHYNDPKVCVNVVEVKTYLAFIYIENDMFDEAEVVFNKLTALHSSFDKIYPDNKSFSYSRQLYDVLKEFFEKIKNSGQQEASDHVTTVSTPQNDDNDNGNDDDGLGKKSCLMLTVMLIIVGICGYYTARAFILSGFWDGIKIGAVSIVGLLIFFFLAGTFDWFEDKKE